MYIIMDKIKMPIPARRALHKLGSDIRAARLRRRIPMSIIAERASISRATLDKIENGEGGVAIGSYANVLFALGLVDHLGEIAALHNDPLGMRLEAEVLPRRIRIASPQKRGKPEANA
jgi:transcriptional regulator with XRE-family HTH domain